MLSASWQLQLLVGTVVTLIVAGVLTLAPAWHKDRGKGLSRIGFLHRMRFMEHFRATFAYVLTLSTICWFMFGFCPMVRVTLLGISAGIMFSIPIGFWQRARARKRRNANDKANREAKARVAQQIGTRLGIVTDRPNDYDVTFLSSNGLDQSMRGGNFADRQLPVGEEPESWIIRKPEVMSGCDKLYVVSKYGWSFQRDGESMQPLFWPEGACPLPYISAKDRYGEVHYFHINMNKPTKEELHDILIFFMTYESVKDYRQSYRTSELAKVLRSKDVPRSPRLEVAASVLERPLEELFERGSTPDIAGEILNAPKGQRSKSAVAA